MCKGVKNLTNLSLSIPTFKYKSQPNTPSLEIAKIPVYFLKTSCDGVFIIHPLLKSTKFLTFSKYLFYYFYVLIYFHLIKILLQVYY